MRREHGVILRGSHVEFGDDTYNVDDDVDVVSEWKRGKRDGVEVVKSRERRSREREERAWEMRGDRSTKKKWRKRRAAGIDGWNGHEGVKWVTTAMIDNVEVTSAPQVAPNDKREAREDSAELGVVHEQGQIVGSEGCWRGWLVEGNFTLMTMTTASRNGNKNGLEACPAARVCECASVCAQAQGKIKAKILRSVLFLQYLSLILYILQQSHIKLDKPAKVGTCTFRDVQPTYFPESFFQ